jgi:Heterokaryon incompatibility protein (HET)
MQAEVLTNLENLALSSKPDSDLALNPETREIRLLSVLPGEWTDAIKCEVKRCSLNSRPRYEALSYAWGDRNDTRPIIVDGCEIRITANLESALRRLRSPDACRTLWADAICIDQSDLKERNHQLLLMRHIFQNCEKALIWLGEVPGSNMPNTSKEVLADQSFRDTQRALKWARVLKGLCDDDLRIVNSSHDLDHGSYHNIVLVFISLCQLRLLAANKHIQELEGFAESLHKDGKSHSGSIMKALDAFASNAWFDRIWVIQEYVVSPAATVFYGPISVSVTTLVRASQNWVVHTQKCCNMANSARNKLMSLEKLSNKFRGLEDARREWLGEVERNLWELGISFRDQLASEDIDKVYSLLGIVRDWAGLQPLSPDYHLPAADVYRQVALDTIQGTKSLLPLQFNLEKTNCPQLPSWVLDWSNTDIARDRNHYAQIYLYKATGERPLKLSPTADLSILGLYCIKSDTITSVAAASVGIDDDIQTYKQWHLFAGLHQNPSRSYSKTCTWHEAYWRTLCADTVFQSSETTDQLGIRRARPEDAEAYACWCMNADGSPFRPSGLTSEEQAPMRHYPGFEELGETLSSDALAFGITLYTSTLRRRLFLTKRGYLGLGRTDTSVGDKVVLLVGGSTPFIVRRTPDAVVRGEIPADALYALIGDCYVHGLMDGEGMELGIKEEPIYLV